MAIKLTDNAANHIKEMLQRRGSGIGLRLGTRAAGCTGFAYVVDFADSIDQDDQVFGSRGVRVIVNEQNLEQLDGTEIDYVTKNILNNGFEFRNPNVKDMCGCGESFKTG